MASDPCIDIDQLCAPISDSQPAGPYWRDDDSCFELFPQVQTAHKDARYNLRKKSEAALFPEDSLERSNYEDPDWGAVVRSGTAMLAKSKDLWIAAWLIEALAHEYGFTGFRDGLKLTRKLCEDYWDSIHPRPDDLDGIRNTLAKLDGDVMALLIPLMPITSNGLTTADYDKSAEMDGLDTESEKDSYRSLGVISTIEFEGRVRDSGPDFLQNLIQDAQEAYDEFEALSAFLDEHCGLDAPASSNVKEDFRQTLDLIRELAKPYLPIEEVDDGDPNNDLEHDTDGPSGGNRPVGWDREHAFREIALLADAFKKNEPTSPVAWMLNRAVQLGNLAWPDLILALDKDKKALEVLTQSGTGSEDNESSDN